jgi:hypothetical protein
MPTFEDRGCRVVSAKDSQAVNLGYLDRTPVQWLSEISPFSPRVQRSEREADRSLPCSAESYEE